MPSTACAGPSRHAAGAEKGRPAHAARLARCQAGGSPNLRCVHRQVDGPCSGVPPHVQLVDVKVKGMPWLTVFRSPLWPTENGPLRPPGVTLHSLACCFYSPLAWLQASAAISACWSWATCRCLTLPSLTLMMTRWTASEQPEVSNLMTRPAGRHQPPGSSGWCLAPHQRQCSRCWPTVSCCVQLALCLQCISLKPVPLLGVVLSSTVCCLAGLG